MSPSSSDDRDRADRRPRQSGPRGDGGRERTRGPGREGGDRAGGGFRRGERGSSQGYRRNDRRDDERRRDDRGRGDERAYGNRDRDDRRRQGGQSGQGGSGFRRDDRRDDRRDGRPADRRDNRGREGFRRDERPHRDDRPRRDERSRDDRGDERRGGYRGDRPQRDDRDRGRAPFRRDSRDGRDGRDSHGAGDGRDRSGPRDAGRPQGGRGPRRDDDRGGRRPFGQGGGRGRDERRDGRPDDRRNGRDDRRGGGGFRRDDNRRDDNRGGGFHRGGDRERPYGGRGDRDRRQERPDREPLRRLPIDEDVTGDELDKDVKQELMSLPKTLAGDVARNLVMVSRLLDEDPEQAYGYAKVALRLASRVPSVREAAGFAAYGVQKYAEALAEFRAARRMTGLQHLWPVMADCERGLGRPEKALAMAGEPEVQKLDKAGQVEMRLVAAGARRDMGQPDAAVVTLQSPELASHSTQPWTARLRYAYADALLEVGRRDEARDWFAKALEADQGGVTDASDRLAELDGVEFIDALDEDAEEEPPAED
ncbi:Tetratricopeptide (TPR) repeat [Streptomyces qinglanensis]|uniref:Tetratricopeptide (TPR) repeat n=1 Tax=Streptomyces qinglanensis TaxID=943816 RepID=A0A1H9T6F3_9ACTN|nr:Tetratricopeptide (TPR) repeat [Streptomyces qinglanensis]